MEQADALGYLESLEDGSLGGVFAAQVVEHLPPAALRRLLELVRSKLRPGGLFAGRISVQVFAAKSYAQVSARSSPPKRMVRSDASSYAIV